MPAITVDSTSACRLGVVVVSLRDRDVVALRFSPHAARSASAEPPTNTERRDNRSDIGRKRSVRRCPFRFVSTAARSTSPTTASALLDALRDLGVRTRRRTAARRRASAAAARCGSTARRGSPASLRCAASAGRDVTTVDGLDRRDPRPVRRRVLSPRARASAGSARPGIVMRLAALERGDAAESTCAARPPVPLHRVADDRRSARRSAPIAPARPRRRESAARHDRRRRAAARRPRSRVRPRRLRRRHRAARRARRRAGRRRRVGRRRDAAPRRAPRRARCRAGARRSRCAIRSSSRRATGTSTLRTTWVEPAYLEPDASWCAPGGEPVTPLANGGAFGGKAPHRRRRRRPASGRRARTRGARRAGTRRRRAARAEASADRGGPARRRHRRDPRGAHARHRRRDPLGAARRDRRRGRRGRPAHLARHPRRGLGRGARAQGRARRRAATVDGSDGAHRRRRRRARHASTPATRSTRSCCARTASAPRTWRSAGCAAKASRSTRTATCTTSPSAASASCAPSTRPPIHVTIEPSDEPPVNGSDAVFAAVAAAAWRHDGLADRRGPRVRARNVRGMANRLVPTRPSFAPVTGSLCPANSA